MGTKSIVSFSDDELLKLKEYAKKEGYATSRQGLLNLAVKLANKQIDSVVTVDLSEINKRVCEVNYCKRDSDLPPIKKV